jgi:hypothetical protein
VTITRTDPADVGVRQIVARIDDGPAVTLMAGDSTTIEVAAGPHRLRAHNTLFWKTVPFTAEPGTRIEFTVVNTSGFFSFGALALVGAAPLYLKVRWRVVPDEGGAATLR